MLTLIPWMIGEVYLAYRRRQCRTRGHRWRTDGLICAHCETTVEAPMAPAVVPVSGFSD